MQIMFQTMFENSLWATPRRSPHADSLATVDRHALSVPEGKFTTIDGLLEALFRIIVIKMKDPNIASARRHRFYLTHRVFFFILFPCKFHLTLTKAGNFQLKGSYFTVLKPYEQVKVVRKKLI
ncbi:hypothetical protein CEXT_176701 [Caerostris extrusa]|uniref:Uncharacterized protein n=1 Tax=Caerostris extrusa TaxID=172846 RepID=A0AAV4Y729_CAEEX|nr:hypothetical protein CEXT_176701 [Caerostris extrusa]